MGILENRPFVLRDIMAFLVLEVLSGLEIDGVSQILLFKNVADGGRPQPYTSLSLIVHPSPCGQGNDGIIFSFSVCWRSDTTVSLNRMERCAYHFGGFLVTNHWSLLRPKDSRK